MLGSMTKYAKRVAHGGKDRRIVRAVGALATAHVLALGASACTSGESGTSGCSAGKDGGASQHPDDGVKGSPEGGSSGGEPSKHDAGRHPATGEDGGGALGADGGDGGALSLGLPSNVPKGAIPAGKIGDIVLNDDCYADTSTGEFACHGGSDTTDYVYASIEQPGGGSAMLFVMKSLRVAQSAQLHVYGGVPAIFYAEDTIKIDGAVNGVEAGQSPAGGFEQDSTGHGGGPGGGDAVLGYNSAGGGSYCGLGGKGGQGETNPASKGGKAYGSPELLPLIGGSSGGGGATVNSSGGTGGAAIEFAAGLSISISLTGVINVGGTGGHANGGAGGSGGALLLEAPAVAVHGTLAANGGGGALNNGGSSGQSGQPGDSAALGSGVTGGVGSAGAVANGGDGSLENGSNNSSGGGGGGAGRIRINTKAGKADLSGATLSPAATTPCMTEGTRG
jgi:hypothetical protein